MVSFYCTRCRKLASFSEDLVGELVSCPFCGQKLVVPDLRPHEKREVVPPKVERIVDVPSPTIPTPPHVVHERASEGPADGTDLSHGVLIHSHLFADKSRRIDVGRSVCLNWSSSSEESVMEQEAAFDPETTFVASRELSDDEFIQRLTSAPVRSKPSSNPASRPVRPSVVESFEDYETDAGSNMKRLYWGLALLVVLLVVGVSATFVSHLSRKAEVVPTLVGVEPISVEGVVTYQSESGKLEGDEGAFVFLFPASSTFSKPLTTSGANPNAPLPSDFDEFLLELEENGGCFVETGFDGLFSIDVKTPGDYWVLVVSKHATGDPDAIGEEELRVVEKYLFLPKRLFARNKAAWTKRTFDDSNRQLEVEFGKKTIAR